MAIYKRGRGFELGTTEKQIQVYVVVRAGLEAGTAGLRVQHADHSTTQPPSNMQLFCPSVRVRFVNIIAPDLDLGTIPLCCIMETFS